MKYDQPDFVKYWNELAPRLENGIEKERVPEAEKYITAAFSLYSFSTEGLSDKITKHKDIAHPVYPMIIQIQDMLRANIFCQQNLLFAPAQFNIRVAFEIRANLLHIYNHNDPKLMLDRFNEYTNYEKLSGRKQMANFESPTPEEEVVFVAKHPYWEDKNKKNRGTIGLNAKWNGEDKSLYNICAELSNKDDKYKSLKDDFYSQYMVTSKFVHGSPVVKEFYTLPGYGLHSVVNARRVTQATMIGTHIMMMLIEDFMFFFGVSYREVDFAFVHKFFIDAQKALEKKK